MLVLATPGVAAADSYEVYPATACQVVSGVAQYTNDGAVANGSTSSWLTVSCPVVRPVYNGSFGDAYFEYNDNSTSNISCTLRSEAELCTSYFSSTLTSNVDNSSYYQFYYSGMSDYNHGSVHFLCSIPPWNTGQSYLVQYNVSWLF